VTRELLEKVPLFKYSFPALRNVLLMALKPQTFAPDGYIAREGEVARKYISSAGERLKLPPMKAKIPTVHWREGQALILPQRGGVCR
jgi:hypothetical protein